MTDEKKEPGFDGRVQPPLPNRRTLAMRRNLPVQAVRFAALNAKMLRMVFSDSAHGGKH